MKTKMKKEVEIPSTIIVRSNHGRRWYWAGTEWSKSFGDSHRYLRGDAERRSAKKTGSFIISFGFVPKEN